ncbi:MAG: DUF3108 domain-containing protein [Gammaproteobacteria bacterium]|jgi:hypothetical protein
MRTVIAIGATLLVLTGANPAAAADDGVIEYVAEYEVRYKGRRVARAEFSVAASPSGGYVFQSSTRARGVWRLASPNPAIDTSRFSLEDDRIIPNRFEFQDGSRKAEDSFSVEFDAAAGEARVSGPGGSGSYSFEPGLLDRGSLQVALMRDLGRCMAPGPYRYVDDDGITSYDYERLEDLETDTGMGTLETVRFSQHREGSSRTTVLWLAPGMAYLPVRIEQIRGGEVETVFTLEEASGIESAGPACSGFR